MVSSERVLAASGRACTTVSYAGATASYASARKSWSQFSMWWPNVSASMAVTMYMSRSLPWAVRRCSTNALPSMSWNEILLLSTSSRKTTATLWPSCDFAS